MKSTVEFTLEKCIGLCDSTKITDRKKGIKELQSLIPQRQTINFLNEAEEIGSNVTWNTIFVITQQTLITETQRLDDDDYNGNTSVTACTIRNNTRSQYSSFLSIVLKTASESGAHLQSNDVMSQCFKVFRERYLRKHFLQTYIDFFLHNFFNSRSYWIGISPENWKELLHQLINAYRAQDLQPWTKIGILEVLNLVVNIGMQQTELVCDLKQKVLPLIESDLSSLPQTELQGPLLSLALSACSNLAIEGRTAVCQFGEKCLPFICEMYEAKSEAGGVKNTCVELMLLQVHCHHPNGQEEGKGGSYACSWEIWKKHLRAMHRIVKSKIQQVDKFSGERDMTPEFVQLAVELYGLLFDNGNYSVPEPADEDEPSAKRRCVRSTFSDLLDEVRSSAATNVCGRWISIISAIIERYPSLLQKTMYQQLVETLQEMQCVCQDSFIMGTIFKCLKSVLKVERHNDIPFDIWGKIWETTLRIVGLNQQEEESHSLLILLMKKNKTPRNGFENLVHMYVSKMVKISVHSLQSLITLCSYYLLPDSVNMPENIFKTWEQNPGAIRVSILELLFSSCTDSAITPELLAQASTALTLRVKMNCQIVVSFCVSHVVSKIEKALLLSAFESGLICDNSNSDVSINDEPLRLKSSVDDISRNAIGKMIASRCSELKDRSENNSQEVGFSQLQLTQRKASLCCDITDHISFMSFILSYDIQNGITDESTLSECEISNSIAFMLKNLGTLLVPFFDTSNLKFADEENVDSFIVVLDRLLYLYQAPREGAVMQFLRVMSPAGIIVPLLGLLNGLSKNDGKKSAITVFDEFSETQSSSHSKESENIIKPDLKGFQKAQWKCIQVMSEFIRCPSGEELQKKQLSVLGKLLSDAFPTEVSPAWFFMISESLKFTLQIPETSMADYLLTILRCIQSLCRTWHKDSQAAFVLISLLKKALNYIPYVEDDQVRTGAVVLLSPFMKKKLGPAFTSELVSCLGELVKVDPELKWARWQHGQSLQSLYKDEDLPPDAIKEFKDENDATAMAEELIIFLRSDFHEVRLAAVKYITELFMPSSNPKLLQWQSAMFSRLEWVLLQLFIFQGDTTSKEERIDECCNRTSTVLHMLTAIIAKCSRFRKDALILLFKLIKEKSLSLDLVNKALQLMAEPLELRSLQYFLDSQISCLLKCWLGWKYPVKEFPWKLFGCVTWVQFLSKYLSNIVPLLLEEKNHEFLNSVYQDLNKTSVEVLEECFAPTFARLLIVMNNELVSDKTDAQSQHDFVKDILTVERYVQIVPSKLQHIFIALIKLVWDPEHCKNLLGTSENVYEPDKPFCTHDIYLASLEYLQKQSDKPEYGIVETVSNEAPSMVQHTLMSLREDMCAPLTPEILLLRLHHYCIFAQTLAQYIQKSKISDIADFVVRDVSYTLMHLIHDTRNQPSKLVLAKAACVYLRTFYEQVLSVCLKAVSEFLPALINIFVPISQMSGPLGSQSLQLLQYLILTHVDGLKDTIAKLPPFPGDEVFEEIREVHKEAKYKSRTFSLEEEIVHFLDSTSTNSFNIGYCLEGLQFLRQKLSESKLELKLLYKELEDLKGFSEDCAKSVLHRLMCTLVGFSSSSDTKIQLEAARCIGELGATDLTTLVLRPAEGCIEISTNTKNPLTMLISGTISLLSDYLLDPDIRVVKAASSALYCVMRTSEGHSLIGKSVQKRKIFPFVGNQGRTRQPFCMAKDTGKILTVLGRSEVWCPDSENTHNQWITKLVSVLLESFSDGNSFFTQLIPLCNVKVKFAEEILPFLLNIGVFFSDIVCQKICEQLSEFFMRHAANSATDYNSQVSSESTETGAVHVNKESVQCMLNCVNFIRLQKSRQDTSNIGLDLNYLHVAKAAQFCSAYISSIMYAELWADEETKRIAHSTEEENDHFSLSPLEFITDNNKTEGEEIQSLLRRAYKHIGDPDAVYGCGSSILLDPGTRVKHYEHMGMWDQALLSHDLNLASSKNTASVPGLARALQRNGLLNSLHAYLQSLPSEQTEEIKAMHLECMWRLSEWKTMRSDSQDFYEWHQYSALKSANDGDKDSAMQSVTDGRHVVLRKLAHSSLETCNNIYHSLTCLQSLQEIEDFIGVDGNLGHLLLKWSYQDDLKSNDFLLLEPILAQRATMLKSLLNRQPRNDIISAIFELSLKTAAMARSEGWPQIAERWLFSLQNIAELTPLMKYQVSLEEAQLAWSRGEKAASLHNSSLAKQLLRPLIKVHNNREGSEESRILDSTALRLYGSWMVATRSENSQIIIEKYLQPALDALESLTSENAVAQSLECYCRLAQFADGEYQRVASYMKSETFENKQKFMQDMRDDGHRLQTEKAKEKLRVAHITLKQSAIDEQEIGNVKMERDLYLHLAIRNYLRALEQKESKDVLVFRLVSLWLENPTDESVHKLLIDLLDGIPSHKFVPLLPQLAARIGDNMKDPFTKIINRFMLRCGNEHPHHTLPIILALANSYKDLDYIPDSPKPILEPRVIGAKQILVDLKKNKNTAGILAQMESVANALISLAYLEVPEGKAQEHKLAKAEAVCKLRNLELTLVPTITLPVRFDASYSKITGIDKFEEKYSLTGGINQPKKIMCRGTDGVLRPLLVKGKDDLRQDAVMQQVFGILNTLLRTSKEAQRRKLAIRTYKIVPLTKQSGVLEWCENTAPLGQVLLQAHKTYYPTDLNPSQCRAQIMKPASTPAEKLKIFKNVCSKFRPAFRYFLLEKFATPGVWFERRLAYIHSVATNSMVGYILGLGDRHVQNILLDQTTAELIHIDFGIAFEQGRVLPTPETVPFRLTRDIIDGMGVSGTEGVFRRTCEKTMGVLRHHQEVILTILEVLLYDPLYAWTITPKAAAKRQSKTGSRQSTGSVSDSDSDKKNSSGEVNKQAERVLLRLKQKLEGTEDGFAVSVEGQVNHLIQVARDPANLCRLFHGWQAYY